jgi:hypothetical protein
MRRNYLYDTFLCYADEDRVLMQYIQESLKMNGLRVSTRANLLNPDDLLNILDESASIAFLLTPHAKHSQESSACITHYIVRRQI